MSKAPVLVLTNERDFAADAVIRQIADRGGLVTRLNVEQVRRSSISATRVEDWGSRSGSVWWRQFEIDSTPHSVFEVDDVIVERAQWRAWLSALDDPDTRWVNPLWEARRAENKIEQLRSATAVGLQVPPTLIANSRSDARAFAADVGICVVKTLSAGYFEFTDRSFVFTADFEAAEPLGTDQEWHHQPLFIQKRIRREADVRVISFGGQHFGALCRAGGADWRLLSGKVQWEPWPVDAELGTLCDRYLERLGLRFAAFDFAIGDGARWFLEANQAGEWLFLDRPLQLGIAEALALYLLDLGSAPDGR